MSTDKFLGFISTHVRTDARLIVRLLLGVCLVLPASAFFLVPSSADHRFEMVRVDTPTTTPTNTPVVHVTAPTTTKLVPSSFAVPITVNDITGYGIYAFQFHIIYNPAVMNPTGSRFGCSTTGTIAGAVGLQPTCNIVPGEEGRLRVAVSGVGSMSGSGTVLNITFATAGGAVAGNISPVNFENAAFYNSGGLVMNVPHDGQITLVAGPTPTPTATFTPTATPTFTPTATPTFTPTATPTFTPTATPTFTPTFTPTNTPTATPTFIPTSTPTFTPTATPTPFTTTTTVTFESGPYVYRGTPFTATGRVTGPGLDQPVAVVYAGDCTNVTTANGCSATASYSGDGTYAPSSDTATISITPADQAITFDNLTDAVYGDSDRPAAASASSMLPVGFATQTPLVCSVAGNTVHLLSAGTCTIRASQAGSTNYNAAPDVDRTFDIAKAQLNVDALAASKLYGSGEPPFTYELTGFVLGENAVSAGVTGSAACSRAPGEDVGTYPISCSPGGLQAANYQFVTGASADLTIYAGTITGSIQYAVAEKAVPDVTVSAAGQLPLSTVTDASGSYLLNGFGSGPYDVAPSQLPQPCDTANGIYADDASMVSRHVVGLITLDPDQLVAAKVTGDATPVLSSLDAALIAQKVVAICGPISLAGNWKFSPAAVSHPNGIVANFSENYRAYLMGDVNGDWSPTGTLRPALAEEADPEAPIASVPEMSAVTRSEITIPLRLENTNGLQVNAFQFDLWFDPAVVTSSSVAATLNGTLADSLSVVANSSQPGLLKVAVYGAFPVSGDGVYVDLRFRVAGNAGAATSLKLGRFIINDGSFAVALRSGRVVVTRPRVPVLSGLATDQQVR